MENETKKQGRFFCKFFQKSIDKKVTICYNCIK